MNKQCFWRKAIICLGLCACVFVFSMHSTAVRLIEVRIVQLSFSPFNRCALALFLPLAHTIYIFLLHKVILFSSYVPIYRCFYPIFALKCQNKIHLREDEISSWIRKKVSERLSERQRQLHDWNAHENQSFLYGSERTNEKKNRLNGNRK